MQAERFRQIRNLFDAALERDSGTREAFLREACTGDEELLVEVGRLLAAHGEPTGWIDASVLGGSLPRLEGRRFGPYQVLRQLGQGGMGSVYLAARVDGAFRKLVALKIVRSAAASEHVLQRSQREREILATLDHPNIARILDGGTSEDGLPYLVMDYVDGEPIDAYCDHHRLDLPARLKLFRDVCAAVQYAHERHVVHRDLKPNNILVTGDGVAKLLDFGIAKLSASEPDGATALTRTDMFLMTPEYASPEQVRGGAATPATDVYALGVVLYELLTGRRPYRMPSRIIHEVVRVICEQPPTRPSTAVTEEDSPDGKASREAASRLRAASPEELKRELSGDLDCILLKALEKDSPSRYPSARAFSEDLRLHLEGADIEARQGALARGAGEFMGRYAWLLIAAAALGLGVYTSAFPTEIAIDFGLFGLVVVSAYAAARHIYGKGLVQHKVPVLAKGAAILTLALMAAVFLLIRGLPAAGSMNALTVISFVILAALNAWVYYEALTWLRRDRRLGPLLQDLNKPGPSFHRESSRRRPLRTLLLGRWYLLPNILLTLYFAIMIPLFHLWELGIATVSFLALFVVFLWAITNPFSRESGLGRPSRFGPVLVILYLVFLTGFLWERGPSPELYHQLFGRIGAGVGPNWLDLVNTYLGILWMLPPLFLSGLKEIRERGLAWSGRLIPWADVLSYSWAQDTGLVEVLCLRIRGGARSSREIRIPMLSAHRPAVDAILTQQFSEWPS